MTDEVTITSEDGTDLEDQAAHDAAVALGAAEVHEEAAEDAAGDAQASAEMAAMAAQAAGEGVAEAVEAASTAEAAAGVTVAALDGIQAAIEAQTATLGMLAEELRESRAAQAPPEEVKEPPDNAPSEPTHGYYGRRIGRKKA